MATTWADIQRLAADLQKAQWSDGLKRLSENNCIEIISTLISSGIIDLVVSTNAKEFITRFHLQTEIVNECLANGNRIALTELAVHLHVELGHIDRAVAAILKEPLGAQFIHCAGELVHKSFIDDICNKMNLKLREVGHISLLQLTKSWYLPSELLNNYIIPELGRKLHAVKFEDQFFTKEFICHLKQQIFSILCALTKPISLSAILSYLNVGQSLFFVVFSELNESGKIARLGYILGLKNSVKSLFVPKVHVELSKRFLKHSICDNGFIELSTLKKLSIPNQSSIFQELFPKKNEFESILFLPSAVIKYELWEELKSNVEEQMKLNNFCNVDDCLPMSLNFLSAADIRTIVELLLKHHAEVSSKNNKNFNIEMWRCIDNNSIIFEETILINFLVETIKPFVLKKAEQEAPTILQALRVSSSQFTESSRGKDSGTKKARKTDDAWNMGSVKNAKKKGGKKSGEKTLTKIVKLSEDNHSIFSIPSEELLNELNKQIRKPYPDELMDELVEEFLKRANAIFRETVERFFNVSESAFVDLKRKIHKEKFDRARCLYNSICTFEHGVLLFNTPLDGDLKFHILKTLCVELCNLILSMFTDNIDESFLTLGVKERNVQIAKIVDANCRTTVNNLFECLTVCASTNSLEKFHEAIGGLCNFSVLLRQPDKSEKQTFLIEYTSKLLKQLLTKPEDQDVTNTTLTYAPTFLLSFILFLFAHFYKVSIHASGRFVAPLLSFLIFSNTKIKSNVAKKFAENDNKEQPYVILPSVLEVLNDTQKLIVAVLKRRSNNDEDEINYVEKILINIETLKQYLVDL